MSNMHHEFNNALSECVAQLKQLKSAKGMEALIRDQIATNLAESRTEVPLSEAGAISVNGNKKGRIDIVHHAHGIEVKVVRMPRLKSSGSNALYDIGQLSADYWRLLKAKKLISGELLILVYGSLVKELKSPSAICRELHNRLYVDYQTSKQFFELRLEEIEPQRRRQIGAIKLMGVNRPCEKPKWFTCVADKFALISIPVHRN